MRENKPLRITFTFGVALLASLMLFGCGGGNSSDGDPPPVKAVTGITLSGFDTSVDFIEGQTRDLLVRLEFDDGSSESLDAQDVAWSSSSTSVISVSAQGVLTAVAAGTAVIQGSSNGQTDTLEIVVVAREVVSLRFDPEGIVLPAGTSSTVRVFGIYNDQSQDVLGAADLEELASSNEAVFTLDETQFGRVLAQAVGTATLSARTATGVETSIEVRVGAAALVNLMVSADELVRPAGLAINAAALGTFTDGTQRDMTTSVNWSVAGIDGAEVSNTGVVSSLTPGVLILTAASNGVSATLQLTFSAAVLEETTILSGDGEVPVGRTLPLELRGSYSDGTTARISSATWSVNDPTVISVNQDGEVQGIGLGDGQVTALIEGFTATTSIRVTPAVLESLAVAFNGLSNGSLPVGLQAQATATGAYSDGSVANLSDNVIWSFSPTEVASISAAGMVTALSPGFGTVTASYQGLAAQAALEVTQAVLQSVRISMESLVDGQVVKAKGLKEHIELIGSFSDGDDLALPLSGVTWVIGDTSVATVTIDGQLQFLAIGTTTLEGRYDGFSDTISVTTSEAIPVALVIGQLAAEVFEATEQEITATVFYSDNSEVNATGMATWTSSDPEIAAIIQGGGEPTRLRAISRGSAVVSVVVTLDGLELSDSAAVTVLPSVLVLECLSTDFFDRGWRRCGSSDGGLTTSGNNTFSVLPRPEWFTIAEFRFTAEGRDWVVGDVLATNSNASVDVRVVGIEDGTVIPQGETVGFEFQVQSTNNLSVVNSFAIDVIGNSGTQTRILTGTYTIRTN